jgi:Ig-like domain-containing protein/beta-propeller repeat-containing protein
MSTAHKLERQKINQRAVATRLLFIVFIIAGLVPGRAPADSPAQFLWAQAAGGSGFIAGNGVAVDQTGNVFLTGHFNGTASFGITNITDTGFSQFLLVKYNFAGNPLWVRQATGGEGNAVAVDASDNVFTTGSASGASFGTNLVRKFDGAGRAMWTASVSGYVYGWGIATDSAGSVYVTGILKYTSTFGTNTFLESGNNGNGDIFVAKYDSAGNLLWVHQAGGTNLDWGLALAVDSASNVYVTGIFQGAASFGTNTLTAPLTNGYTGIFLAKYDTDGNLLWVTAPDGSGTDYGKSVAVDSGGNPFISGYFSGTAAFGANILTASLTNGNTAMFVAKYNSAGNCLWAQQAAGNGYDYGRGVALNAAGEAYVTGTFHGTAAFGSTNVTSSANDIFVARYGSAGDLKWVVQAGASANDTGFAVALDTSGNAYVAGTIGSGTTTFGGLNLSGAHSYDNFITQMSATGPTTNPPAFSTLPASRTVNQGATATFSVAAFGSAPLTYQWQKNGTNIDGATTTTFTLSNVQASDAANYSVIVGNAAGSTNSGAATLTVILPPTIASQTQSETVAVGANTTLSVTPNGTPPFSYQWRLNGTNLVGQTGASLTLTNLALSQAGNYSVVVSNPAGTNISSTITLTLDTLNLYPVLTIGGPVGSHYRIDYADALGDTNNWIALTNVTLPANPYFYIDAQSPLSIRRFYRVTLLP